MASSFMRLYRYAKAVGAEAKENYTTEALRAAIETDPRPLLDAVRGIGVERVDALARIDVNTQVAIRAVGQIDLVVEVCAVPPIALWFEVKVDAGESGQQLTNYRTFISERPAHARPILIVLGPHALGDSLFLSWQRLRRAIVASGTASPYWHDFKLYLEEIRMADSYDEPVTDGEAHSLESSRKLFGKVARILTPFAAAAMSIWPGSMWPQTEPKIVDAVTSTFLRLGTLGISHVVQSNIGVSAGAYHDPVEEEVWLGLWMWCRPNYLRERHELVDAVRAAREWDEEWYHDGAAWELFGAYHRLKDFESHAAATAWLAGRLTDLKDTGLLLVLGRLAAGTI
jgi:hypothetical protein